MKKNDVDLMVKKQVELRRYFNSALVVIDVLGATLEGPVIVSFINNQIPFYSKSYIEGVFAGIITAFVVTLILHFYNMLQDHDLGVVKAEAEAKFYKEQSEKYEKDKIKLNKELAQIRMKYQYFMNGFTPDNIHDEAFLRKIKDYQNYMDMINMK